MCAASSRSPIECRADICNSKCTARRYVDAEFVDSGCEMAPHDACLTAKLCLSKVCASLLACFELRYLFVSVCCANRRVAAALRARFTFDAWSKLSHLPDDSTRAGRLGGRQANVSMCSCRLYGIHAGVIQWPLCIMNMWRRSVGISVA